MDSFLHRVATTFAHSVETEELEQYAFVFPNRRAGLFFRKHLAKALDRPILSPAILTINECFYELSDLRLADSLELLFRVYSAYKQAMGGRAESFDTFLFWGKMMLSDFSEIDNHLVENVRELYTTIKDLKDLELRFDYLTDTQLDAIKTFWSEVLLRDKDDASIHQNFTYVWSTLYPTYENLRASLKEDGMAYDGMLHRELIEHWEEIPEERFRKHYVFVGFNALTRSEEQLMLNLQQMGIADFYFDYYHPWLADKNNRASLFKDNNIKQFHSAYALPAAEFAARQQITWIQVPSTVGETYEVNRLLNELGAEKDLDLTRTAVVLPDERMLLPMLSVFPDSIGKINVTMGYPLSATPVFSFLQLLKSLRAHANAHGFYHKDVLAVMSHRYARKILGDKCVAVMSYIREKNCIYYADTTNPILDSSTPTIAYIRGLLTLIDDKDSEELYLVETALNRIEKAISDVSPEEKTIFALITMMIGDLTIPYVGEPLEGLQVMGVLETRVLDFDNLIITGFNDELYPGKSQGNSYIPYILRKGFGLPTPERQDAIFAYNFYRMLGYASRVWFITNSRADEQHSGEASRYLYQLRYQYQVPIKEEVVVNSCATSMKPELRIEKTPYVMEQLQAYASVSGNRGFSPSAINEYLRCPLSFYWGYVAGVRETESVKEDLDERDLGTVVHMVLETLYAPFAGREVNETDIAQMKSQLSALVDDSAAKKHVALNSLSRQVTLRYLSMILDHDKRLTPFVLKSTEERYAMNVELPDGSLIRTKGTIDRVDEWNGQIRVVDYKSGQADLSFTDVAALFDKEKKSARNKYALQTILYCLLYITNEEKNHRPTPIVMPHIYAVRSLESQGDTVLQQKVKTTVLDEKTGKEKSSQTMVDVDVLALREPFMNELKKLISEVMNPEVPFTMTQDSQECENCALAALCK